MSRLILLLALILLALAAVLIFVFSPLQERASAENRDDPAVIQTAAASKETGPPQFEIYSPFKDPDRKNLRTLRRRIIGRYGDYRRSYKPGHLHAGTDFRGAFEELVYPIARGEVYLLFREFPHKTIVIRHDHPVGEIFYSLYVHVEDIRVREGEAVDENTPLARLFTEDELFRADFGTDVHLHLEIRPSLEDGGAASYSSMNRADLDRFCMDPLVFFRRHLRGR
jgi:murein DD-endopeptidase MepM/ murein hydrolase activator NlpD